MRKRFVDVAYAFFFQHLWLLTGLCLLITVVGVLLACIRNGHLPPEFPSPSDTGVFQPEGAYFTFGLFWAMIGLAATIGRHALVFGTFLDDQRKHYRGAAASHSLSAAYGGGAAGAKSGWLGGITGLLLSERDDAKLLKMGTIIGVAGACFGTMVAAFDVRKHVVLHTIGAACLFIFTNLYYSLLLRINYLIMEKFAVIRDSQRRDEAINNNHYHHHSSSSSSSTSTPSLTSSSIVLTTSTTLATAATPSASTPSSSVSPSPLSSSLPPSTSKVAVAVSQGHGAISNLTWLRVLSVMGCWFCLLGIIGFRLQFVRESGHQAWDKERVAFLIFWANLFEWIWLGLVLVYGFIVFYWDYYHSPVTSPYFGFSTAAANGQRTNPLVFRLRCEVQRPDDVHIV